MRNGVRRSAIKTLKGISVAAAVIILLKLLTQSVWETFYKKYIEPYITKKLYVILEGKEILEDREALSYVEGKAISIDIISLIVIIVFSILLVVFITKGVYSWRNSKENAHERGFALAARALINDLDYVLAAQMYRYSIDAVGHGKNKKRRIIIYHIDSECVEGVDINAIVQEEFFLEERYFRAIARFLTVYGSYESSRNKEELKKAKKTKKHLLL